MEYTQLTRTQRAFILRRRIFDLETKHYMAALMSDGDKEVPVEMVKLEDAHAQAVEMLTTIEADLTKTPDPEPPGETRFGESPQDRANNNLAARLTRAQPIT